MITILLIWLESRIIFQVLEKYDHHLAQVNFSVISSFAFDFFECNDYRIFVDQDFKD